MTRRTVARILVVVFGPMLVGAGLLWYGLGSERVAKTLIAKALARTGETVKIGSIRGTLSGPLILGDVRVRTETFAADVDSVYVEWRPTGLIRRQVRIDRLYVTGVNIVLPDSVPRDTAPKRPALPMDVLLGDVKVDRITVTAPNGVSVDSGTLRMAGRAEDYRLTARGIVTVVGDTAALPSGRRRIRLLDRAPLAIEGHGDLVHLELDRALTTLFDGRIAATGEVEWFPKIRWDLSATADSVRPGMLTQDPAAWPGRISARARTVGVMDSIGPVGSADVDSLGGAVRGHALGGTLAIRFAGERYEIPRLAVDWGSAHVDASGNVAEEMAIDYDATVGNIGMLVPGARGAFSARGRVTGAPATPRVRATFEGRRLAQGTNAIARVSGRADVDLAPGGRTIMDVRGSDARVGRQAVDRIVMALRGTQRSHRLTAEAIAPDGELTLAATGRLDGRSWRGRLASLDVQTDRAGDWGMEAPVPVAAAMRSSGLSGSLGQLCLAASDPAGARVCAAGTYSGRTAWRAASTVERLPLALIDSLAPDSLVPPQERLTGTLAAALEATASGQVVTGTLTMRADSASIGYFVRGDTVLRMVLLDTAAADARIGADGVHGTLALTFLNVSDAGADTAPVGRLQGELRLPRYTRLGDPLDGQPLEASLTGTSDSLAFLTAFFPNADSIAGTVALELTASGTATAPRVEGTLTFDSLSAWLRRGRSAQGSLAVSLEGTVGRDRSLSGELRAVPRGVLYNYRFDGIPRRTVVDSGGLVVRAGSSGIDGVFTLGLSDTAGGRIVTAAARLTLPDYRHLGDTLATQRFTFKLDGEVPDLAFARSLTPRFDTLSGRITLAATGEGTVAAPSVNGRVRVENVRAHSPTGSVTTGGLAADLTAAIARDSSLTAELRVVPENVRLSYVENGVAKPIVLDDTTRLEVRAGSDGVRGTLAVAFSGEQQATLGAVNGRFALPQYVRVGTPLDSTPLEATIQGGVPDLSFAEAFSPEVDSLAGRLTLDARLAGTAGDPSVSGGLRIENGTIRIPLLGALYREIQVSAIGAADGDIRVDGSARAGAGELTVAGSTPLRTTAYNTGTIRIRGQNFELANSAQLHAVVSPDIEMRLIADTIALTGEVQVPLARLQLSEIPEFAVPPSDDIVFIDDSVVTPAVRPIRADVRIVLGDSVSFKGFNFNAELGGAMAVRERPGLPTTGSGAVVIEEGRFKAYGQDLTITDGRVRFAGGPVDNPGLDIRATRTANDGTVAGLQIGGTLKDPRVTIYSEPAMSQNRALHYIVTGRPPGEGTGADGNLLSKAASSIGLRGGNLLASSVGQGLGFSDAGIQSEGDLQQAAFVAGRYLSPSLYVSYGIGLFDPISTLRLRYLLSSRWTLQAEAGATTGADLLFRIERGSAGGTTVQGYRPVSP